MDLLRIGTRYSRLSLQQTLLAESFMRLNLGESFARFSLVKITTSGDRILDKPLYDIGGKGLFTKELDLALLEGRIDLAVHSAKDIEATLPTGLVIACYLPRGDRRDCLITTRERAQTSEQASASDDGIGCLLRLAQHSRLGTASPRRRSLVRLLRDDLEITLLRGNIERRLASLSSGANDSIILASCALERLGHDVAKGISKTITMSKLDEHAFVSAVGQGAIAIVVRESDSELRENLRSISDISCQIEVCAERAFLHEVGGNCHTALGASARLQQPRLTMSAFVIEEGKKKQLELKATGDANKEIAEKETIKKGANTSTIIGLEQAESLGIRMAKELASSTTRPAADPHPHPSISPQTDLARETTNRGGEQGQIEQG